MFGLNDKAAPLPPKLSGSHFDTLNSANLASPYAMFEKLNFNRAIRDIRQPKTATAPKSDLDLSFLRAKVFGVE